MQIYNGYTEKLYVHYKEKNLVTIDEQIEHLKTCGAVNAYRRGAENEANLKCKRAQFTHRQIHELIDELKGNRFWWTIKYLIR